MTSKQQAYRKQLVQQVHVSPRYQNYFKDEREEYEQLLFDHFGERSSRELSITQLQKLVDYFNYELPELPIIKDRSKDATEAQITLLNKLWMNYATDTTEKALRSFVKRVTGNMYLHVDRLTKKDATKCIVALKKTLKEL